MGIETIAEFVENGEIIKILKEYGVDYAQGYFIGKPSHLMSKSISHIFATLMHTPGLSMLVQSLQIEPDIRAIIGFEVVFRNVNLRNYLGSIGDE